MCVAANSCPVPYDARALDGVAIFQFRKCLSEGPRKCYMPTLLHSGILHKRRAERSDLWDGEVRPSLSDVVASDPFPAAFQRSRSNLRFPVGITHLRSVSRGGGFPDSFSPFGLGRLSGWALCFARSPGKSGTHFHPSRDLFLPSEKKDVITSTVCWIAMVGLLTGSCHIFASLRTQEKLSWYRSKTEAAQPVLGKYYREPEQSGPLPLHLFGALSRSLNHMITLYLILETSCIINQMINHAVLQKWSHDLAGEKLS
ncbi:hypothetical protein ZIOFF_018074 [Zingiber officinale]|uniref:Uncharacterized protein n=1 Tax=Zingiber officinale TaxID=94328 RepID=A0A8J5LLU5_ZINOF|nr:hypothetical protein ZIOFF_018074 [Zingiber officinale]